MSTYRRYQYWPLANPGNKTAPSCNERLRSKNASALGATTRPMPLQRGHIPVGSLNENALDSPTCGSPAREKSSRSKV
jgi:hypothetical protein